MEEKKYEVVLINDEEETSLPKLAQAISTCTKDTCALDYSTCAGIDECFFDFA